MAQTKNVGTGATIFDITYSLSDGCTGEVTFSSDSSWLTLGSKTSTKQTVNVAQNDTYSSRTGNITPSYKGSSCSSKIITVNQEGQTADLCGSVGCSGNGSEIPATATSHSIIWSIAGGSVDSIILSNTSTTLTNLSYTTNGSSVNFSFDNNSDTVNSKSFKANAKFNVSSGSVTTSCTVNDIGFTQAAASVTCNCVITSEGNLDWLATEYGDGKKKLAFTIPNDSACGTVTPSMTLSGPFTSAQTGNQIYIYPTSENTSTTDDNTGTAELSITCSSGGGGSDTKSISLTQNKKGCTCQVDTGDLSWAANDSSEKTITVKQNDCTTSGSIIITGDNASHFTASTWDDTNKRFKISPTGANEGSDSITATAKVSISCTNGSDSKDITLTHNGTGVVYCGCGDFNISTGSTLEIPSTGGTITAFTVTKNSATCTPSGNITAEVLDDNDNIFTVGGTGSSTGDITIRANANEKYSDITKTVKLTYNGDDTCTAETQVTLKAKVCPTYTINPNNSSGTGGTVTFRV